MQLSSKLVLDHTEVNGWVAEISIAGPPRCNVLLEYSIYIDLVVAQLQVGVYALRRQKHQAVSARQWKHERALLPGESKVAIQDELTGIVCYPWASALPCKPLILYPDPTLFAQEASWGGEVRRYDRAHHVHEYQPNAREEETAQARPLQIHVAESISAVAMQSKSIRLQSSRGRQSGRITLAREHGKPLLA